MRYPLSRALQIFRVNIEERLVTKEYERNVGENRDVYFLGKALVRVKWAQYGGSCRGNSSSSASSVVKLSSLI